MRHAPDFVKKFPVLKHSAKARLRPKAVAGVHRLIALAPILGTCNPKGVPIVERIMLNLIGTPPKGGRRNVIRTFTAIAKRGA